MVEEYTLSVDCPLGTMVGPGRYGMYWVAREILPTIGPDNRPTGEHVTVFRSAMPTDFTAVLVAEREPCSVAEAELRRKRGVLKRDGTKDIG